MSRQLGFVHPENHNRQDKSEELFGPILKGAWLGPRADIE
jgi:hypothetical protein